MALPLVVILGPTASGKSALAVALAQRLAGEVVSADAFAVYRGMDVGTAKPSLAEQQGVPHHLISELEPSDRCDVQRWLELAEQAIAGIRARSHLPIVAGGTPLYVKALLEGLSAGAPRDPAVRGALEARYEREGGEVLFAELQRVDPTYAADRHPNDKRRLVRALEVHALTGQPYSSFHTTDGVRRTDIAPLLIGLEWPREVVYARIDARAAAMFERGLVDEVRSLAERLSPEAAQAVGYKEVLAHFRGEHDLARALTLVQQKSRNLAKHQMTWYRGWPDIRWLIGDAVDLVDQASQLVRDHLTIRPGEATH
ncbi:MAG TPA: tRNA (adenosine(37)-N6)-dimethylallyltransferase MiaA [Planctomycetota bacterium]|nr:tRNA (adenosine(37)-N6)-dimethylallyltransferase MiaA [Planctomycetota bacterium]